LSKNVNMSHTASWLIATLFTDLQQDAIQTRFHLINLSLTCCVDQMTQLWLKIKNKVHKSYKFHTSKK
jgi:hypothetical protein